MRGNTILGPLTFRRKQLLQSQFELILTDRLARARAAFDPETHAGICPLGL